MANEAVQFVAVIANSPSAIRIEGEKDAGGRIIFEVPGDDVTPLVRLIRLRGRALRITAEVLDGDDGRGGE